MIDGPGGYCVTAGLLAGALSYHFDTVQKTITKAITTGEYWKGYIEGNPTYDLVRFELTYDQKTVNGTFYNILTVFKPYALHRTNPSGWVTL